jgi:hypothetical protein
MLSSPAYLASVDHGGARPAMARALLSVSGCRIPVAPLRLSADNDGNSSIAVLKKLLSSQFGRYRAQLPPTRPPRDPRGFVPLCSVSLRRRALRIVEFTQEETQSVSRETPVCSFLPSTLRPRPRRLRASTAHAPAREPLNRTLPCSRKTNRSTAHLPCRLSSAVCGLPPRPRPRQLPRPDRLPPLRASARQSDYLNGPTRAFPLTLLRVWNG